VQIRFVATGERSNLDNIRIYGWYILTNILIYILNSK
jgi:hypothetical protein